MRIRDHYSAGNVIAANGQSTFTSSQIPSTGLIALHFAQTGAGNSLASVARQRIKANGQTIMDFTPAQLRAFLQSTGQIPYSPSTVMDAAGAGVVQDCRRWSIPFCDLTQPTKDMQDQCQFPLGANITVETQYNGGAGAGLQFISWTQSDNKDPACYPKLIGQQMQIAAGSANGRFNFSDEGIVRGIGLPTIGLNRARLVLSTMQVLHTLGQVTSSATIAAIDNLFVEADQLWNRFPDTQVAAAGATYVPTTFYNPYFMQIDANLRAPSGGSYIELATDAANWGGPTNEFLLWSQVEQ